MNPKSKVRPKSMVPAALQDLTRVLIHLQGIYPHGFLPLIHFGKCIKYMGNLKLRLQSFCIVPPRLPAGSMWKSQSVLILPQVSRSPTFRGPAQLLNKHAQA